MAPLVSVIITSYNAEPFIEASVRSILGQTFKDLECLVVDDGSNDRTISCLNEIRDSRLRILQPGRVGRGRALNIGIQEAQGQLIAIQDADDLSHVQRLEIQVELMKQNPHVSVLGSGQKIISESDSPQSHQFSGTGTLRFENVQRNLFLINPISHTSLMVRRATLEAVSGYNESRKNLFDWDLLIRLYERGYKPYKHLTPLVFKRIHDGQQFEMKRHFHYVKSCFSLQWQASRRLHQGSVLLLPMIGLFFYRLLPHSLRMTARRCYGIIHVKKA